MRDLQQTGKEKSNLLKRLLLMIVVWILIANSLKAGGRLLRVCHSERNGLNWRHLGVHNRSPNGIADYLTFIFWNEMHGISAAYPFELVDVS